MVKGNSFKNPTDHESRLGFKYQQLYGDKLALNTKIDTARQGFNNPMRETTGHDFDSYVKNEEWGREQERDLETEMNMNKHSPLATSKMHSFAGPGDATETDQNKSKYDQKYKGNKYFDKVPDPLFDDDEGQDRLAMSKMRETNANMRESNQSFADESFQPQGNATEGFAQRKHSVVPDWDGKAQ